MGAYKGPEIATDMIQEHIKATIAQNLANVRNNRATAVVTTEPPREYFIYPTENVYRAPGIFTIFERMQITNIVSNGNHINAKDYMTVACVVEDRLERLLTIKCWRYQAALMQSLHQVVLTNADASVKLFLRVDECVFSDPVALTGQEGKDQIFRKEVGLKLIVDHIENLE
jgi:hypothetical protein